jgi:hypothetical protein
MEHEAKLTLSHLLLLLRDSEDDWVLRFLVERLIKTILTANTNFERKTASSRRLDQEHIDFLV